MQARLVISEPTFAFLLRLPVLEGDSILQYVVQDMRAELQVLIKYPAEISKA